MDLFDQRGAGEATFCSCPTGNCRARPQKNQWISLFLLWRFGRFVGTFAPGLQSPGLSPYKHYKQNTKPLGFILRNLRNSMCTLNFDLNPMICVILWICCFRDPKIHLSRRGLESLQDAHRELKQPPGHVGYVGHRPAMSCF